METSNLIQYHQWIDVTNPINLENFKKQLNVGEAIVYISKTTSKWSKAIWDGNKLVDSTASITDHYIIPKYVM